MQPVRVTATVIALLAPGLALAAGLEPLGADPVVVVAAPAAPRPALEFTLRGGVAVQNDYFGSSDYSAVPDIGLNFHYLRLPGGRTFGSQDPNAIPTGLALRGAFRYIRDRDDDRNPELNGLDDIDTSVELGLGLIYKQRNFEAFADARYGVVGHNAFTGTLGADLVLRPSNRLTITAGPRILIGSDRYSSTYFGVTPVESAASGLAAYEASGGILSTGVKLGAHYDLTDQWGIEGAVTYDHLMNDAADSPITAMGDEDQFKARIGITRRIRLEF